MARGFILWVSCWALLMGCEDEPRSCTLVGCADLASVTIEGGPRSAWADGHYTLDISLLREHHCTFELPTEGVSPGTGAPLDCTPALPAVSGGSWSGVYPLYGEDGGAPCSSEANAPCTVQGYRVEVQTDASAQQVEVRLAVEGVLLLEQASPFEYQTLQPNGPECGPTCRSASVQMYIAGS